MTDEKVFCLDGPQNWFSYNGGKNDKQCRSLRQQGGGSLMCHCTTLPNGNFNIVMCPTILNSDTYMSLLEESILPYINRNMGNNFRLQQDNAPAHSARKVKEYLSDKRIEVLEWPAKSPDLNVVEKVWSWLADEVYQEANIYNIKQLKDRIMCATKKIQKTKKSGITNFYDNYFDRIMKIIEDKGSI